MARFPFTASSENITLFFDGRMYSIPQTDGAFDRLYEHLKLAEHDYETVQNMVDKPKMLARFTAGLVSVVGSTVYYKGAPVHSALALKLVGLLDEGFDATPWAKFLDRLMLNPSERSRNCLYDFLDNFNAPLTEDGCFIAFKRVRDDYRDLHSGTMDNSPGRVVEMPREAVDSDPDQTCSRGLHACATSYLDSFYSGTSTNRVVVLKIDPADVVAVPRDYNFAKMRVSRYEVLGDVAGTGRDISEIAQEHVYAYSEAPISRDADDDEDEPTYCDSCGDEVWTGWDVCDDCQDRDEDDLDEDEDDLDEDEDDLEPSEMSFMRDGRVWSVTEITAGVKRLGQRGYSRITGVPRSTLQEWITKIEACS